MDVHVPEHAIVHNTKAAQNGAGGYFKAAAFAWASDS